MRTPGGKECQYFYGDYYRGRRHEECRLIGNATPPNHWTADLCKTCPFPDIARDNACPNMIIEGQVESWLFGFRRRVKINTFCTLSQQVVKEPHIGCGQCHPLPKVFTEGPHDHHPAT
jgi:hypothetical protein